MPEEAAERVVEEAVASGITDIILVTQRGQSAMEDHFDSAFELETQLKNSHKTKILEELQKIHRVTGRKLPGAPHEVWLVLDATTGQNAISQAEMFNEALGVTGIILTKLDGTAKGGIVVGISHQLGIPIRYIGIGEKADDLRPFIAQEFLEAIFD